MREKPEPDWPRRLADWINPEGARKVHSLVDKVYSKRNLAMAWERVRRNGGSGGIDGQSIGDFAAAAEEELERLHQELKAGKYEPRAVRQQLIPKAGQPGKMRPLGIPTVYDRVCQQAVLNRLEGIFEPVFDEANFGYRAGRSAKGALRKIWREIEEGQEWIVDADLKDFFGSVSHEKLLTLVNQRVADGRVLGLIAQMLRAGVSVEGTIQLSLQGTPQGGVISPLLSNILLTPLDREMRRRGHRLTRYADDWVVTCGSRKEAEKAMTDARKVLATLGVTLNEQKTRIVHITQGFEFLGYKIKRGTRAIAAARTQGQKRAKRAGVCLSEREEHSILHGSNPRTNQTHSSPKHGWIDCGNQSDSSWMGKLLLQGTCPKTVRQVGSVDNAANLEPSHEAVAKQRLEITTGTTALWRDGTGKLDSSYSFLTTEQMLTIVKAGCGKSARPVWEADGGQHRKVRLLRPDSEEVP